MQQVTVRVPASTSNLGPGFDCLGVALSIYNSITVVRNGEDARIPIVAEAARLFFKECRLKPFRFGCAIQSKVPRARGLGSSASVRTGVLHGLNRLAGEPLDRISLFRLCAKLERHPDNAAPANFGGFTVVRDQNLQRFNVSKQLSFILL